MQNQMRASVTVVIVNYKVAPLVIECLRSLEPQVQELRTAQVVVVENDSKDGSFEALTEAVRANGWDAWVKIVASDKNGGYSYGNNTGVKYTHENQCETDYYWLLNPDTLAKPGAMNQLVKFMEKHPEVGICGSSIEMEDGTLWPYCFRFPNVIGEFDRALRVGIVARLFSRFRVLREMSGDNAQVDWLPGASMMVRATTFNDVGLLDDDYFLYYEETDFCLNSLRKGWQCWYVPDSRIMHIAGASTGVTGVKNKANRLPQYWFDSRKRYFVKNHGVVYAALADIAWLSGYTLWYLRRLVTRRPNNDPERLFSDSFKNSVFIRPLLRSSLR